MAATSGIVQIVDDEEPLRDALAWLLKSHHFAFRLHPSAESFLAYLAAEPEKSSEPGCIVLDIRMPGVHGDALFEYMRNEKLCMQWPVIFLTGHGDIAMAVEALKKGAFDFVEKPFNDESFITRIETALAESARRLRRVGEMASLEQRLATLTSREREIMELIVAGHYNKVIADRLGIVPRTVEFFRARILRKLGVKTAVELASVLAARDRSHGK